MMLLAIDIGTTNVKVGLLDERGSVIVHKDCPNRKLRHRDGYVGYDPELLWATVAQLMKEAVESAGGPCVRAVGIASMAESGLLADRVTGRPRTHLIPWFETVSVPQAERIKREVDVREQFVRTGLLPSFKQGLSKLLWLKEISPESLKGSVWLSASAYIAYRLTGRMAEDYTLAARTFAFRIDRKQWDEPLIRHFGLRPELFPPACPAGTPVGSVLPEAARLLGLQPDTVVGLAGHDHVCASLTVPGAGSGGVYNSMGTAETMVGTFAERALEDGDYASGLSFGLHSVAGTMFWMGGHSTSGGSVEWMRELIGGGNLTYARIMELLEEPVSACGHGPTGILFFPYLSGSGAPQTNHAARAAFVGLTARHGAADMLRAVLEGNAYQMELLRERAAQVGGSPIHRMAVVGGGAKNPAWLQIKADVSNVTLTVPDLTEATLVGAALTAGVGAGVYASFGEAMRAAASAASGARTVSPDAGRNARYRRVYEHGFKALAGVLAGYGEWLHEKGIGSM